MSRKSCIFAPSKNNGLWCNGNTTDSGPVILGSNPGSPAKSTSREFSRGSWTFCRFCPAFLWGRCFIEVGLLVDCVFGQNSNLLTAYWRSQSFHSYKIQRILYFNNIKNAANIYCFFICLFIFLHCCITLNI